MSQYPTLTPDPQPMRTTDVYNALDLFIINNPKMADDVFIKEAKEHLDCDRENTKSELRKIKSIAGENTLIINWIEKLIKRL